MKTNLFTARNLIWFVIFAVVFCTGYESQGASQATDVSAGDNTAVVTAESPLRAETAPNDIVVTVNGIGITNSQIEE